MGVRRSGVSDVRHFIRTPPIAPPTRLPDRPVGGSGMAGDCLEGWRQAGFSPAWCRATRPATIRRSSVSGVSATAVPSCPDRTEHRPDQAAAPLRLTARRSEGSVNEFSKVLVANRGEIAIRVLRAANEMGKATVAVFSNEDRLALHRSKADESYRIGEETRPGRRLPLRWRRSSGSPSRPGPTPFTRATAFCPSRPSSPMPARRQGIVFIGPRPDTLRRLGDKVSARVIAMAAGVPTVPATEALPADHAEPRSKLAGGGRLSRYAQGKLGWRRTRHADGGGFGRVRSGAACEARREATAAFGKDEIYFERFIRQARHLEVQVLADAHGPDGPSLRARLLGAAAQPEDRRVRPGPRACRTEGARRADRIRPRHRARVRTISTPARWSSFTISTPAASISSK